MALTSISVQLYSVRNALEADPDGTVDRLAEIGLRQVEAGYAYLTRLPQLAGAIRRNGLGTPTLTAPLFRKTEAERAAIFALATELGAHTVVDTHIPEEHWQSLADVDAIAEELNAAALQASDLDLRVGYHNHWWELDREFDGATAFDQLIARLDTSIVLEVDAYWVAVGGVDPVEFVGRHADRVHFLHLKDGPINRVNTEQRPAGTGSLPIDAIIAAATNLEVGTIEFDDYAGDVFEAIAESFAYLSERVSA